MEAAKLADFDTISFPATGKGLVHPVVWEPASFDRQRVVQTINAGLRDAMNADDRIVLIGEDIEAPYGGAFKCTKDLSSEFGIEFLIETA